MLAIAEPETDKMGQFLAQILLIWVSKVSDVIGQFLQYFLTHVQTCNLLYIVRKQICYDIKMSAKARNKTTQ
jgi:hypothetical protein